MTDEREASNPPAPDSNPGEGEREGFRSRQQTLAMGGNVNEHRPMPSLVEIAAEFVEQGKSPRAQGTLPNSAPVPSAQPEPAALPSLQEFWRRDSRPTHPGEPGAFDLNTLGLSTPPEPGPSPETFSAQLKEPSPPVPDRLSSPGAALERLSSEWSPLDGRRRWWSVGAITAVALVGGFWFGSGLEQPAAEVPTPAALDPTRGEPTLAETPSAGANASDVVEPSAAPPSAPPESADTGRDPHFAVRTPARAESCDDVLGRPFAVEADPHPGKSGAFWSRSRQSLLRGHAQRALEQMCLSASWDLSGRGTYGLSEYYFQKADFEQARAWAERVPEGSKRYGDARTMVGDVFSQQGRMDDALQTYLAYWNVATGDEDERADLAVRFTNSAAMARRKGDWWTAERFYRRALVLDPDYALAAAGLARALGHFELHEGAVYWGQRALALDAESVQAAMALCEAWIQKGNPTEAAKALATLSRIAPNHPAARSFKRRIARLSGG